MKITTGQVVKGWVAAAALGCVLAVSPSASACPNCVETTADTSSSLAAQGLEANPALGYSISIIFMLGVLSSLLGGTGYAIYRQQMHGRQDQ